MEKDKKVQKDVDYYLDERGLMVFTKRFLLERGYCCKNGCKHCPYGDKEALIHPRLGNLISEE